MNKGGQFMKKQRRPFYQRKLFLWLVGSLLFITLIIVSFRVSPWPGAMVIRFVFNNGGAKTLNALEPHAQNTHVTVISDQQYQSGDGNAKLDVYYPDNTSKPLPVVIWTHGGAWLSGDKTDDGPYFKLLSQEGFAVVSLNYTLAPSAIYPTALRELNSAYSYLQINSSRLHIDMNNVILAGDSAGANMSAQMVAMITNPSYAKEVGVSLNLKPAQLKGVILYCGIYKMEGLTEPSTELPKIVGWGNDVSVWAYSGTRDFSSPLIKQMSPYYHITKDFPPTYISGGNADPLTDAQSIPLADKLRSLGVAVDSVFYPADHQPPLAHEYQFNLDNSDGKQALAASLVFIKKRVGLSNQ